jgi:photosystem II stability/assembly factor-like uncharacterized protein
MKKQKLFLFFFTLLMLIAFSLNSEGLKEILLKSSKPNFKTIQRIIHQQGLISRFSERELKQYDRWTWFWSKRVGKDGNMDAANRAAYDFLSKQLSAPAGAVSGSKGVSTPDWTSLGPTLPISGSSARGIGRVQSIWVDAANYDFILIGAASGGLWKTVNGGTTWTRLTDNIITVGISDIEVNPSNHNEIYVSSGVGTSGLLRGTYGVGVLKSTNGGLSWSLSNIGIEYEDQEMVLELLMHPTNPSILYALTKKNIYKTTNGGANWSIMVDISSVDNVVFRDFKFKPGDPNTVYVCGNNSLWPPTGAYANGAIWRLYSDGEVITWTQVGQNISLPSDRDAQFIGIGVRADQPDTLYAGYVAGEDTDYKKTRQYFYKSTDQGANWVQLSDVKQFGFLNWFLDIDFSVNGYFYASSYYLYRSGDELATFNYKTSGMHPDIRRIQVFPQAGGDDTLFAASDGGVFRSDNSGNSWVDISGNLAINQFYSVSIYEADPDLLLGGTHDCGNMRHNSTEWRAITGGDGGSSIIDYSNPDIMYYLINRDLFKSTNGGSSEIPLYNEVSSYDGPIVQHPSDPDTIIVDGYGLNLRRSTNGGSSWTIINPSSSISGTVSGDIISALEICGNYPDTMYYATTSWWHDEGSLVKSSDGGGAWTVLTLPAGLPLYITGLTSIESNPESSSELWIGLGFFEEDHKVYHSSDGGATWTNQSTGLPNFPVNRLVYDPDNYCLYAASDVGVYYKASDMTAWERFGNNLPYVMAADMKINSSTGKLVLATHGRGMWEADTHKHLYADIPYTDGFESGDFGDYWYFQTSTSRGRVQVTSGYTPYEGSYHVTMDVNVGSSEYNRNELWLRVNLKGKNYAKMQFRWKDFDDETHSSDGVYLSDDGGASFVKIHSFDPGATANNVWQTLTLDLKQLAYQNNLDLNRNNVIKFQQYDNYPIAFDGMAIDYVKVYNSETHEEEETY